MVLAEMLTINKAPHPQNYRAKAVDVMERAKESRPQFGIEQEYVIFSRQFALHEGVERKVRYSEKERIPYKWLGHNNPGSDPDDKIFYEVGGSKIFGRDFAEEHFQLCLKAGLQVAGINSESLPAQWEYQVGVCDGVDIADQLIVSRYILLRLSEKFEVHICLKSKPYKGYATTSGLHTNFSTEKMREGTEGKKGIEYVKEACVALCEPENHKKHIPEYGDNSERLIGHTETSHMPDLEKSTWGICQKDVSIRIPEFTLVEGKGYLEDRRPTSEADPYRIITRLVQTVVLKE